MIWRAPHATLRNPAVHGAIVGLRSTGQVDPGWQENRTYSPVFLPALMLAAGLNFIHQDLAEVEA